MRRCEALTVCRKVERCDVEASERTGDHDVCWTHGRAAENVASGVRTIPLKFAAPLSAGKLEPF